ncbi:DMT family transporter [Flavivirga rizhaonensis]|uniref:DMT family transporter n=2 Tax=Flavivirga rizhaonensis TaxID=2559571 RepID=A0A4S1DUK8_9FLAO|nr:DMT family transporter [Flavivirga rizhaonensis]TGV01533.1 DMT family transporter [Flavivirga rizhaonensis]
MEVKNAIKFMLISTLAFACMNAIVKQLVHINAYQIVFFRSIASLVFTFTFLLKNNISIFGNQKKLLVIRGLVGVTSMTFFFMSTKYLPIGTAVSLRYIAPIFAAIFAVFLLREKVKPWQWFFFAVAFMGVLILKGFDTELNSYGLLLAVVSAIFSGLVYITIRKIGKGDHPVVVVNYFMVISTIVGGVLSTNNWVTPVGIEWVLLIGLGAFGYYGQLFMTKAFQIAATNIVAPFKYLEVLYTVLFGVFIFTEIYTFWSLLGIALIIAGLVLNILYKEKLKRKENHG